MLYAGAGRTQMVHAEILPDLTQPTEVPFAGTVVFDHFEKRISATLLIGVWELQSMVACKAKFLRRLQTRATREIVPRTRCKTEVSVLQGTSWRSSWTTVGVLKTLDTLFGGMATAQICSSLFSLFGSSRLMLVVFSNQPVCQDFTFSFHPYDTSLYKFVATQSVQQGFASLAAMNLQSWKNKSKYLPTTLLTVSQKFTNCSHTGLSNQTEDSAGVIGLRVLDFIL